MLNPSSSGWIRKYFSMIIEPENELYQYDMNLTDEELLYGYMQPTGISYGFPTNFLFLDKAETEKWSSEEKFKVLLLESMLTADIICHRETTSKSHISFINRLISFYEISNLGKAKKSWLNFKGLDEYAQLESIIDQRVDLKMSLSKKLWTSYLHNSLVFQDVILYFEYQQDNAGHGLAEKRSNSVLILLKILAAAAMADGEIAEEEEALFAIFLASATLEGEDEAVVRKFWEDEKNISHIEINTKMSWLQKRYMLELATLMVWSDRIVAPSEQTFLNHLSDKLEVEADEQDKSFIAIQAFVLKNADAIPFLSAKNEIEQLMSTATKKWKNIISRNKDKLAAEMNQNKELVQLIAKSTTSELDKEEKKKIKSQFKELAKTIPAFALFLLPGGSVIMPIVLKIIPDLIPSSFRSNKID